MPRTPDNPWGFDAVIDFIDSDCPDVGSPESLSPSRPLHSIDITAQGTSAKPKPLRRLGSFTSLFEKLGIPLDVPAPTVDLATVDIGKPATDSATPFIEQSSKKQGLKSLKQAEVALADEQGSQWHIPGRKKKKKKKHLVLELDVPSKQIDTAEIASPDCQDDPVPSLTDDHGDSGDSADSPEDEADAHNAEHDPTVLDPQLAGMTKKQRKRARKRAEKAKNAEDRLQSSKEKDDLLQITHSKVDEVAQESARVHPIASQQPRPKGGAKIRSMSPVEIAPPSPVKPKKPVVPTILKRQPSAPVEAASLSPVKAKGPVAVSMLQREHAQETATNSKDPRELPLRHPLPPRPDVAKGFQMPTPIRQAPASLTPRPSALNNLSASLSTQYTTVGGNIPYHQKLPPGFATPSRGHAMFHPLPNRPPSPYCTPGPGQQSVVTPKFSQTLAARPREDRNFDFLTKLIEEFPEDKKWLVSPMRLASDKLSPQGIHVFVDASNILIGFREQLRRNRTPSFDMSFDCLALLLERRRPVAKRVYAGSTRLAGPLASAEKFADIAGEVGYQKDIYEQVYKVREQTESQKFFKDVDKLGWAKATQMRAGSGSDSETGPLPTTPPAPKWVEQGVDESLHLKMCQSILDAEVPSTMVLATGDGAAAEYSDGFLAHVERALKRGWKVELVSWRQQTSGGYRNKKFRAKWGGAFRVIELDEYLQWMVDN